MRSQPAPPASETTAYDWLAQSLNTLHRAHWHRQVQPITGSAGPIVEIAGQSLLNFASNDYLGLASDPRLAAAAAQAIKTYGTGSTGSRLLSGHRTIHQELEQAIAALKRTDDAIVFSSGYLANLGTVSALMGARDLIVSDQYNHASLKSGARLSGATLVDYAHSDVASLRQQLQTHRRQYRRCLIVTDSVFSMDGDCCPLPEILDLAAAFDSMVMVDEAHGTGVLGATGAGFVEQCGCSGRPLIQMGTLSKALGSLGGYVAGSAQLIDFLRNRAPSWVYTTGLSPAAAAAALAAIAVVKAEPSRRQQLQHNAADLRQRLDRAIATVPALRSLQRLPSASPIVCLQVKDAATVLNLGQRLRLAGIFAAAVRPPTVPTSRLRLTVMATHQSAHLDQLMAALMAFD
ncbi:MAG: 8-amino-7-oxononanoate synthase [Leptolyngbya sp. SIO4C1]|nr:8-amino-7-oxononanoate synthase [Leptolyngbya sp. SIO4C1]